VRMLQIPYADALISGSDPGGGEFVAEEDARVVAIFRLFWSRSTFEAPTSNETSRRLTCMNTYFAPIYFVPFLSCSPRLAYFLEVDREGLGVSAKSVECHRV